MQTQHQFVQEDPERLPLMYRLSHAFFRRDTLLLYIFTIVIAAVIYIDLACQNLTTDRPQAQEVTQAQWPKAAAILHPLINMLPGAIDPRYTEWQDIPTFRYGLEQGILRAIGAMVIVAGLASLFQTRIEFLRGALPLNDKSAVLFLDIQGLPLAAAYAQALKGLGKKNRNLEYAVLYPNTNTRPERPPDSCFRNWHAEPVDLNMDVTDTNVLKKSGALSAKCVILSCSDYKVLGVTALTIWSWRNENGPEPTQIIPISEYFFGEPSSVKFPDHDFPGADQTLTEIPLCPFIGLIHKLENLFSVEPTDLEKSIDFLTVAIPKNRKDIRLKKIKNKIYSISEKRYQKIPIHLNGEPGGYSDSLSKAVVKSKQFTLSHDIEESELILTYGNNQMTGDLQVNEYADNIRSSHNITEKLHLYLTFSQGNEDSASLPTECGASIQRILVAQLIESTSDLVS